MVDPVVQSVFAAIVNIAFAFNYSACGLRCIAATRNIGSFVERNACICCLYRQYCHHLHLEYPAKALQQLMGCGGTGFTGGPCPLSSAEVAIKSSDCCQEHLTAHEPDLEMIATVHVHQHQVSIRIIAPGPHRDRPAIQPGYRPHSPAPPRLE